MEHTDNKRGTNKDILISREAFEAIKEIWGKICNQIGKKEAPKIHGWIILPNKELPRRDREDIF